VNARFLVAAEWVGIATSAVPGSTTVRFVSGGVAHALDADSQRVVCGADPTELELFVVDFVEDPWAFRCRECEDRIERIQG
jgi:hypothetical protein